MKSLRLFVPGVFSLLFLAGCPVYDVAEFSFDLESASRGDFEVCIGPIGSDRSDAASREEDLAFFIHDVAGGGAEFSRSFTGYKGEMIEGEDGLYLKVSGSFDAQGLLSEYFDIEARDDGGFELELAKAEMLIETDGSVEAGADGASVVTWPGGSRKLRYKVKNSLWEPAYSLAPEYARYLEDPEGFGAGDDKKARKGFGGLSRVRPEGAGGEAESPGDKP